MAPSDAALAGLDLTIERGEFIALLGPSGCGKSTALNCLAGLLPLTPGSIWQDEPAVDALPPERRGFGMVFQNYALFPHLSVRKNIAFGLQMRRVPRPRSAAGWTRRCGWCTWRSTPEAARAALRRPAAAGGDRPRGRAGAVPGADGRATVQPGRQAAAGDADGDPPAAPVARADHRLRHARPGGGAVAGRPPGRAARRPGAADRHAGAAAHRAGQLARRRLHGLSQPAAAAASRATATRRGARRAP